MKSNEDKIYIKIVELDEINFLVDLRGSLDEKLDFILFNTKRLQTALEVGGEAVLNKRCISW